MIDRVLDDWMTYKDVERQRAMETDPEWAARSALWQLSPRFNLMTNFIVSEVARCRGKFIRIAWHSYLLSSFNTLVAIISGLRSPWIMQAIKTFKGIGRADDFKYIRQTIADIKSQDHKSMTDRKPSAACVPFIGVYLSQLHRHNQLPDLIDPTAPTEASALTP
ncbi:ras guanine nucleotide exchange factor domain-containing protein, partial [Mycena leptocephala]